MSNLESSKNTSKLMQEELSTPIKVYLSLFSLLKRSRNMLLKNHP